MTIKRTAMKAWNGGLTVEQAVEKYGPEMKEQFEKLEVKYGCASIPLPDLLGYTPKKNTDPKHLAWKGEIGPGAELKKIIASSNNATKDKKD